MKLKVALLLVIFVCFNCKAQNPVLPLDDWHKEQINAYYKDLDNKLNPFVGTWLYTDGNASLKIILKKEVMYFNGKYYEDLIVGEYQYIENGIEKINTLMNINTIQGFNHQIDGNNVYNDCDYLPSSDCIDGETRLDLSLSDPLTNHYANTLIQKRIVDGQEALKVHIIFRQLSSYNGYDLPKPEPTMPWQQEYLLIKQD